VTVDGGSARRRLISASARRSRARVARSGGEQTPAPPRSAGSTAPSRGRPRSTARTTSKISPPVAGSNGRRAVGLLPVRAAWKLRSACARCGSGAPPRRSRPDPSPRAPAVREERGEALRALTQDLLALGLHELQPELRGKFEHDLLFEVGSFANGPVTWLTAERRRTRHHRGRELHRPAARNRRRPLHHALRPQQASHPRRRRRIHPLGSAELELVQEHADLQGRSSRRRVRRYARSVVMSPREPRDRAARSNRPRSPAAAPATVGAGRCNGELCLARQRLPRRPLRPRRGARAAPWRALRPRRGRLGAARKNHCRWRPPRRSDRPLLTPADHERAPAIVRLGLRAAVRATTVALSQRPARKATLLPEAG